VKKNNFKIVAVAVLLAAVFLVYNFNSGDVVEVGDTVKLDFVVEVGDTVKLDFVGKLEDGSVFDSSEGKGPLEFEVGSGIVIAGFDEEIRGMKVGDKKTITVPSEKAYGNYDESKIGEFPKEKIPDIEKVGVGDKLFLTDPSGGVAFAIIKEIGDEVVVLDLNHPLTGKTLIFEVEILEIN
jgi:peptidylprolyl isomerase